MDYLDMAYEKASLQGWHVSSLPAFETAKLEKDLILFCLQREGNDGNKFSLGWEKF